MPARSGQDYVDSLKKNAPCVYLGGRRVADVTAEPIFQEPIRAIAEQYDMQLDPAYRDVMTYPSPSTGEPVSTSFLVPYTREELVKKRQHFKLRADHNFGFMGRAPDFMNQFVTGWHLMADRFARGGRPLRRERHPLLRARPRARPLPHPHADQPADRPLQDLGPAGGPVPAPGPGAGDARRHHRARGQDAGHDGADHRGGRGDSLRRRAAGRRRLRAGLRHPDQHARPHVHLPGDGVARCRARASTIRCRAASRRWTASPCSTTCWCRGTGCIVDGSPGSGEIINTLGADFGALLNVQTTARMLSQLEFFCGLAMKLADAIGITGFLHIQEKLGEMLSHMEMARAVFYGAEAMAQQMPNGVWVPGGPRAARLSPPDGEDLQPLRGDRADAGRGRVLLRADRGRPGQPGGAPLHRPLRARARRRLRRGAHRALQAGVGRDRRDRSPSAWPSTCASTPAIRSG